MIKYLTKLFKKTPSKPLLKLGDRISLREVYNANKCYIDSECIILKDMLLLYRGEKQGRVFFYVRCNFDSTNLDVARDKDLIYFYKPTFEKMKYRIENI